MPNLYDVLIIGGGPGGYTAALYCARAGIRALVLEKLAPGGQMATTGDIDNYPGFEEGIDGFSLGVKMQKSAERFGTVTVQAEVKGVSLDKPVKEIETTGELNEIIKAAIPAKMRQNGHPSKKTFQAIRIECNRELEVLKNALDDLVELLNPGGRLCIITFHSLEDRIVKTAFRKYENPCTCPPEFPVCVCGAKAQGKVITKKPILPSGEELEVNSRSKSAKLRVFEKI